VRSSGASFPFLIPVFALVIVVALGFVQVVRGLPEATVTIDLPASTVLGQPSQLPMPSAGSSIVSVEGLGTLATAGATTPRPIASVTKIMTAYVILKNHPLRTGESGPVITFTARDAERYLEMVNEDQSVLAVRAGMQLTQFQMLQGMLIPSANNFAETIAVWDAGSVTAFVAKMNAEAQALGMTQTTYTDTSGFFSSSVSTAADQLLLSHIAMENPVFREIVGTRQVTLPGIGLVNNVNQLLGQEGVIGIKTGFTEEAGGNLAFAAQRQVSGRTIEVQGVVLGQATRPLALEATRQIVAAVGRGLQISRVVSAGQRIATIDTAWGGSVAVLAGEDLDLISWPGMTLQTVVTLDEISAPLSMDAEVGWIDVRLGEQQRRVPLRLAEDLPGAGLLWRLTRT
jgi:D-alanyl-D-alanine carboxypeptidase (penicillin-binding protein 5/6)